MTYVMMCDVREQTFGQRVKDRREELELTQTKAAKLARIGVDTWRAAERGYKARSGVDPTVPRRPARITVRKMAKVLGWTPAQALTWAGYDEPVSAEPEPEPEPEPRHDSRQELVEILGNLPERCVQLLLALAHAMAQPAGDSTSGYSTKVIEGPVELPDPRGTNGNHRSLNP